MANTSQAKKRAKQAEKSRVRNVALRSRFRTLVKNVVKSVSAGDKKQAEQNLKIAVPIIDSMVNKGMIHRNKAARHKSRLHKRVRAASA